MEREEFFLNLYSGKNDKEKIIALLELRGFLLEKKKDKYILSDNSHPSDTQYLDWLLRKYNIGYVDDGHITIKNASNFQELESEFKEGIFDGRNVQTNTYSWSYFRHRKHGYKVPVSCLEPFIARYVKALSSAGVILVGSCDGNKSKQKEMRLMYTDPGSPIWHDLICKEFLKNEVDIYWNSNQGVLAFGNQSKYDIYEKVNRAAEFIYDNRKALRKIKRQSLAEYTNVQLVSISHLEIEKSFRENVCALFKQHDILQNNN